MDIYDATNHQIPLRLRKYWRNRYHLFSKFDEGIRLDEQAFYSVKPERLANEIASKVPGNSIYDACCGAGGTAIAFAMAGKLVVASDISPSRIELASNNANVYGVADRIKFIVGDVKDLLSIVNTDAAYFDPPWGGIDYQKLSRFNLADFDPNGMELIKGAMKKNQFIAFSVPRNFNRAELSVFQCTYNFEAAILQSRILFYNLYIPAGKIVPFSDQ